MAGRLANEMLGENLLEQPFPCCLALHIASGKENTLLGTGEGIPLAIFTLFAQAEQLPKHAEAQVKVQISVR